MQDEQFVTFEDLILTHKQEVESGKGYPYNIILEKDGQHLSYLGSNHSTDPEDGQYIMIDENWEKFLALLGKKIVLIEGGEWEYIDDREAAIKQNGEGSYLKHLSVKSGIENLCAEPPLENELKYLLTKHSKEEIFYFLMARYIRQWPNMKDSWPTNLDTYLQDQMNFLQEKTGWSDIEFFIDSLAKIHAQLFNTEIDLEDYEHFEKAANPTIEGSAINLVSRNSSRFRDIHIVTQIARHWKEGKHIFIVFGSGHVIRQEPAIKAIMGV